MSGPACVVGDIGGTNARFAVAHAAGGGAPVLEHIESFPAARHPTLLDAVTGYAARVGAGSAGCVLAVAGPVENGFIDLTNSPWRVSETALVGAGFARARLINDFEALAWAAPVIGIDDLVHVGGPDAGLAGGALAVIGPGTGFGVSALARSDRGDVALATEGGHAAFAPHDAVEAEVVAILARRFGPVSIERLVSGAGLVNLHRALAELDGREPATSDPAEITRRALAGEIPFRDDLARFCAILGGAAGDIALTLGARGGVYIAGGIVPRMIDFLKASAFRERFEAKGRFQDYMQAIPTWVVVHSHAALLGAARRAFLDEGRAQSEIG